VINDAKSLLTTFPQWEITQVRRGANGVGHYLARQALVLGDDTVWRLDRDNPSLYLELYFVRAIFSTVMR
jgi:hypothetical protein